MLKVKLPFLLCCTLFVISLQAQTVKSYILDETPDDRYTLHTNGTVTDTWTGLMWQRCSIGQEWIGNDNTCDGSAILDGWWGALDRGERNIFAGYSDWRLPNRKELRSIVAFNRYHPAINPRVFPNISVYRYWSSSPNANDSSEAWIVDFKFGYVEGYSHNGGDIAGSAVRLVRGGQ
ncbi:MAG: DUF1566 domain-containing protein [Porticoccaceae bacterium]